MYCYLQLVGVLSDFKHPKLTFIQVVVYVVDHGGAEGKTSRDTPNLIQIKKVGGI